MEIVTLEDSLERRIKEDIDLPLSLYSHGALATMFYNICASDNLLDYIENNDIDINEEKIKIAVSEKYNSFLDDMNFAPRFPKDKIKKFIEEKDEIIEIIAFIYIQKIRAIRAAKKRRKKIAELDKEIDAYHSD